MEPREQILWNGQGKNKPALIPDAPAFFNPFFFTIKLAPIKELEESASTSPFMLSADMPVYDTTQLPGPPAMSEKRKL